MPGDTQYSNSLKVETVDNLDVPSGSSPSQADHGSIDTKGGAEDIFDEVKNKPCKVTEVEVKGFQRTKPDVVGRELVRVKEAKNLEEIRDELLHVFEAFQELDVFSEIDVDVEKPLEDTPDACRVEISLVEKDMHFLKATTFVQSEEGGIDGHIGLRNVFGRAERFRLMGEFGSRKTTEYALEFLKPRIRGLPWSLDVRLFSTNRSNLIHSSFVQRLRGVSLGLESSGGMHKLAYEIGWQHLTDPTNMASLPIQQQLGHKLRSSLSYNLLVNKLQPSGGRPELGWCFRWFSELGGLHPHAHVQKFNKHRTDVEVAYPLTTWASTSFGFTAGLILPTAHYNTMGPTNICDRFFLGGIGSLRGFQHRGCGPSATRRLQSTGGEQHLDALGGDALLSGKASINFDIPIAGMKAAGIYGHAFGNIGNSLLLWGTGLSPSQSIRAASQNYRTSVGVGLVWPLASWGSLEINYVQPLRYAANDRRKPGFELGFGANTFNN